MNLQTAVAFLIVALCAAVMLRSWFSFWIALIRKPDPKKQTVSSCSGCANGCQRSNSGPKLVELKREGPL